LALFSSITGRRQQQENYLTSSGPGGRKENNPPTLTADPEQNKTTWSQEA